MTALRRRMIEDMRIRNFSPLTQQAYIRYVARFLRASVSQTTPVLASTSQRIGLLISSNVSR